MPEFQLVHNQSISQFHVFFLWKITLKMGYSLLTLYNKKDKVIIQ